MSRQANLNPREKFYLLPGELMVVEHPCEISTVLGSCVAIIIYDSDSCLSGMIHYLLPRCMEENTESIGKYANTAFPQLIELLQERGIRSMHAKIFGGGRVLENVQIGNGVGEENINIGLKMLDHYGIPVMEKNLGGTSGRKICFSSDTHRVVCDSVRGVK